MEREVIRISITGDLGSGKSSVCKILEDKYALRKYSTGVIQREIARKYNMSTYELNKYMETHPEIDNEIDDGLKKLAGTGESLVVDSRMAWHFTPDTFKVFLAVDINEAARRIVDANRGNTEQYASLEDAVDKLRARKKSENTRYQTQYGVNCADLDNFGAVIDTTVSTPDEIADLIIALYRRHVKKEPIEKFWCSARMMYPTKSAAELDPSRVEAYAKQLGNGEGLSAVSVLEAFGKTFIYEGHHKVCAWINSGRNMMPYRPAGEYGEAGPQGITPEEYVKGRCSRSGIQGWEKMLNFTFKEYPDFC